MELKDVKARFLDTFGSNSEQIYSLDRKSVV